MTEPRQNHQNLVWSDWRPCWWTCRWNPTLLCAGRWTRRQETRRMDSRSQQSLRACVWECEWTVSYSWTKWHPNTKQFNLGFQRSNLRCYCREYNNNHKIKLNKRALSSGVSQHHQSTITIQRIRIHSIHVRINATLNQLRVVHFAHEALTTVTRLAIVSQLPVMRTLPGFVGLRITNHCFCLPPC